MGIDTRQERSDAPMDADGIPGWYPPADQAELARLASLALRAEGCFVEFGSYQGRSAAAICGATDRPLICVDPWTDPPGALPGGSVLERFCANTRSLPVIARRMGWREWVEQTAAYGVPIAFCHIDADHSYAEVADAIRAVVPMMAAGGVLCGHDYGWPDGSHAGVKQAVDELLPSAHVGGMSVWSYALRSVT